MISRLCQATKDRARVSNSEASLLTDDEKIKACELSLSRADFVKTSTGFSTGVPLLRCKANEIGS